MGRVRLSDANALDAAAFGAAFGDIAEHTPWVADVAGRARPFASRDSAIDAFQAAIATAPPSRQLDLLCAHPDLAGRAAVAGDMTAHSVSEQSGAGLDRLTADEFVRFTDLNMRYRQRFGFPFILAVRGATKHEILQSFAARVNNSRTEEFLTALAQVCRIVRFRLEDRIDDE